MLQAMANLFSNGFSTPEDGPQRVLSDTPSSSSSTEKSKENQSPFEPSALDVLVAKALLLRGIHLPIELVDVILDQAEYWPHTSAYVDYRGSTGNGSLAVGSGSYDRENRFLLRTNPLGFIKSIRTKNYSCAPSAAVPLAQEYPAERYQEWIGTTDPPTTHPCRKIVFTIESHDQGWGGSRDDKGSYNRSWTWFDVGLERFDTECNENEGTESTTADNNNSQPFSLSSLRSIIPAVEPTTEPTYSDQGNQSPLGPVTAPPTEDTTSPYEEPYRLHHDLHPSIFLIQRNRTSYRDVHEHVVEWRATDDIVPDSTAANDILEKRGRGCATGNGEFVRSLKLGDVVTVWAKARFPGWRNYVSSVKIDVYWAI